VTFTLPKFPEASRKYFLLSFQRKVVETIGIGHWYILIQGKNPYKAL